MDTFKKNFKFDEFIDVEVRETLMDNLMRDIFVLYRDIVSLSPDESEEENYEKAFSELIMR